jgi:hypothetical protein
MDIARSIGSPRRSNTIPAYCFGGYRTVLESPSPTINAELAEPAEKKRFRSASSAASVLNVVLSAHRAPQQDRHL